MKISELGIPVVHNYKGEVVGFEKDGDIYARCENCLCYHIEEDMIPVYGKWYCAECVEEMPTCGICNRELVPTVPVVYMAKHNCHVCVECIQDYHEMVYDTNHRVMGEL